MDEAETLQRQIAMGSHSDWPKAGEVWRHNKGHLYDIVAVAVDEAGHEPQVVYRHQILGHTWVRPVSVWLEKVRVGTGEMSPRFTRVKECVA